MGKWKRECLVLILGNEKGDEMLGLSRERGERKGEDFLKKERSLRLELRKKLRKIRVKREESS